MILISAPSALAQDGSPAANLIRVGLADGGKIVAQYSSGQQTIVGQLAMANFNNPKGLIKMGSNRYSESASSGIANVGVAATGGRGSIIGSALESSNVDIATEFTQMILAQRGYQANSRSITTADEILVETLQMKR